MKLRSFKAYQLLLLLLLLVSCSKDKLVLIDKGHTDYTIVLDEKASEEEKKAAAVLQDYLQKITSVKVPVKLGTEGVKSIYLKTLDGDNEEIGIRSEDQDLVIYGGSDKALMDAVYVFLEQYLGCDWYTPDVASISEMENVVIDKNLNYVYRPEIEVRTVHSRLFYENHTFADEHKVTKKSFPFYVPEARVHTFHKFIPEEQFYKEYPEYFALRNGKRLPTQLCLTNPEVLRIVIDSVASLFEKHPEATVASVSQNDNQQYCECDACKAIDEEEGSHAGTMIRFVNKVAERFPDKTISTLAYQYTRKPSKTRPDENVLVTLCSIECDRSGSIENKCEAFAEDLKGWGKLTDKIRIWDYTTQFTNFLAPFPNIHTLQPNIKLFRDNNVKWVFEQHSNNPSELFELRSYVTAKLLWNPDLNLDSLMTVFTDGYYQEAGTYIKQYVDTIHKGIQDDKDFFLFLYGDPSQAFSSYLNPEKLKQYTSIFDAAEAAVKHKPQVQERVKAARLGVDYAVLEACRKGISEDYSLTNKTEAGVNQAVVALLDKFKSTCEQWNITMMNEMGFTVNEYCDAYRKAIEVAKQPNIAKGKKVVLNTKPKKYADEDPQTLTDGALGGNNFYANWLGFEGNDLDAVVDLEGLKEISTVSSAFLQVTNHIVFYPSKVTYYVSNDGVEFKKIGSIQNPLPLNKESKINDIQYFKLDFDPVSARYVKIIAENLKEAPYWHHAAGLPSWIFIDEIIIN
ncbi:DUF4838 domain-containing protein [Zhouia amylolytica]|uniref:DUF4838 domain-containing protein n=1 Tax=Zhouia amylolytica TaxID=376730 RepID=UPI0020CD23AE|nr:DUF4838 domain-containing protein [Zhouia amylolytica]MCQ0110460.1 DUF4838 domain-containing protein [Zhouia amylolytica]